MSDGKRILQLDGLRAVAVLMVFAHHAFDFPLLWSGVDLFFVLSGFLITGNLLGQRRERSWSRYFGSFYARRARRIIPPYCLLLGLTSIIFGVGWVRHWYLFLFLMNTGLFRRHVAGQPHLWSLAVEEQFYLLWPVAVYLLDEAAIWWLAGGMVVAAPLLRWIATLIFWNHGYFFIYSGTPFRMDLIAAGALLALAWRRHREVMTRFGVAALWFAGGVGTLLCFLASHSWFDQHANTIVVNVWLYELTLLGYVGVLVWALSGRLVGFLTTKPLVYLGQISYTVYLVHVLAMFEVYKHAGHSVLGSLLALGAALCCAALSWHFIERPILRGRRRRASPDEGLRAEGDFAR